MSQNPYIQDILTQATALQTALEGFNQDVAILKREISQKHYDRILVTGMGASYSAAYPAWLALSRQALPVTLWETAELIHYARQQITPRTLLWVISQSGESAEIHVLLEHLHDQRPAFLLAITNNPKSTLARAADVALELRAGEEYTVSTRTYLNTLAVALLTAQVLLHEDTTPLEEALQEAQHQIASYLEKWNENLALVQQVIGIPERLFLLGRGVSLASALTGGLILKEAAKFPAEGMSAAQFRHGPLELVEEGITALIFAGAERTRSLNQDLALDIQRYGGKAIWVAAQPAADLPWLPLPAVADSVLPLVEILPIQGLSVLLAESQGRIPGQFRYIGKVTTRE